jgi:pre-mRNA-splicing helicase BRR2
MQPREIIFGAADEVLTELKRDDITEKKKKVEVEGLLGEMPEEKFALLVGLGKKITDFGVDKHQSAAAEG